MLTTDRRRAVPDPLVPPLAEPDDSVALRTPARTLTYRKLSQAASAVARRLRGRSRVAVWADPTAETCVAVVGALAAGVTVIPLNPGYGARELEHIVADAAPELLIAAADTAVPAELAALERYAVDLDARPAEPLVDVLGPDDTAFILYTSGTTGPPKGAMLPRRAVTANLDALADAWRWTGDDVLAHALPLFHVHGLILGVLGPLRLGGQVVHVGRFDPAALAAAFADGATMLFAVPTMYQRILQAIEEDPALAEGYGRARLLVSGSAALPATVHRKLEAAVGVPVIERYGLTETLILTAVPAGERAQHGTVGVPLRGTEIRLLTDEGELVPEDDHATIGEIVARADSLFSGYLNRPDATSAAMRDGWFHTGDLATRRADGALTIVGRRATDLIKSGGYKIGAGEIEDALLAHPDVREAAVAGRPDEDLGERVVAWVVAAPGSTLEAEALQRHVSGLLAFYKKPRTVHFVDALPRNAMGKVMKAELKP